MGTLRARRAMPLYICMLFEKSRVIDAIDIDAPDGEAAFACALTRYDQHPECSKFELWHGGRKIRSHTRPAPTNSELS